jgi:hypothetical protein
MMARERSVREEAKTTVRAKRSRRVEMSKKRLGSQAVRMPPELPRASTVSKQERLEGRRKAAMNRSIERSFVYCKQTIEGEAEEMASRTTGRFLRHPNP